MRVVVVDMIGSSGVSGTGEVGIKCEEVGDSSATRGAPPSQHNPLLQRPRRRHVELRLAGPAISRAGLADHAYGVAGRYEPGRGQSLIALDACGHFRRRTVDLVGSGLRTAAGPNEPGRRAATS